MSNNNDYIIDLENTEKGLLFLYGRDQQNDVIDYNFFFVIKVEDRQYLNAIPVGIDYMIKRGLCKKDSKFKLRIESGYMYTDGKASGITSPTRGFIVDKFTLLMNAISVIKAIAKL